MSRSIRCYLVVDLRGDVRVVKTRPRLTPTEIAVEVNLNLPTPPALAAVLNLEIPDPPPAVVEAIVAEWTQAAES